MCKYCRNPNPNIVEEFANGDLVCADCGLVLGDRIVDTRSEWRTFANDDGDDPSRVGAAANPLLSGSQLDTIISRRDGGSGAARDLNKTLAKTMQAKMERNLLQVYKEISAMCDAIGLPRIISDVAKQLYKRAEDEKFLRGKPTESVVAACIFIACRQEKVPRTFKEICALTRVPKKDIGRTFKVLMKVFGENGPTKELGAVQIQTGSMASEDLMARFCSNLGLPMEVQRGAVNLVRRVNQCGTLAGKSPVSVAAACIYMVSVLNSIPKPTKDIAYVAGVSEVSTLLPFVA